MLDTAFVVLFLAVLSAPTLNAVTRLVPERPLYGKTVATQRPRLAAQPWLSEEFQRAFVSWYEASYGARGFLVRLDSSISYHVFHEARPEHPVRVGRRDVLYVNEDTSFFNADSRPDLRGWAASFKHAQDRLWAQKRKLLMLVVVPSKTTVDPEDISSELQRPLGTPRPSKTYISDRFVGELTRVGAVFVDARPLLSGFAPDRQWLAFSPTGRHWTRYGACLALQRILEVAASRFGAERVPEPDCTFHERFVSDPEEIAPEEGNFDIYRLLNVWNGPLHVPIPEMSTPGERVPRAQRIDALFVGSSFLWGLIFEAERNHALRSLHYYYYNTTVDDRDNNTLRPVEPHTQAWRELTFSKDLIVLDMPEPFMVDKRGEPGLHNVDFLGQLEDELSADTP